MGVHTEQEARGEGKPQPKTSEEMFLKLLQDNISITYLEEGVTIRGIHEAGVAANGFHAQQVKNIFERLYRMALSRDFITREEVLNIAKEWGLPALGGFDEV